MDLGAIRDLALDLNLQAHGFAVTVTRPQPNLTPIVTRGLWLRPLTEPQPFGADLKRRQPRRALVLPLDEVPNAPQGTTIIAPAKLGGPPATWVVDGYTQPAENDLLIVSVIPS